MSAPEDSRILSYVTRKAATTPPIPELEISEVIFLFPVAIDVNHTGDDPLKKFLIDECGGKAGFLSTIQGTYISVEGNISDIEARIKKRFPHIHVNAQWPENPAGSVLQVTSNGVRGQSGRLLEKDDHSSIYRIF